MSAELSTVWPLLRPGEQDGGGENKQDKKCRCKSTSCVKMYCDCFSAGRPCSSACRCTDCRNTDTARSRSSAPWSHSESGSASTPPLPRDTDSSFSGIASASKQQKGCRCKKSKCLKNYCECRAAGYSCSNSCQCVGCLNVPSKRQEHVAQAESRTTRSSTRQSARSNSIGAPSTPMLSAAQHFKFSDNLPKPDGSALRPQGIEHQVSDDPQHIGPSPEEIMAFELLNSAPHHETAAQQEQRVLRHLISSLKTLLYDSLAHPL